MKAHLYELVVASDVMSDMRGKLLPQKRLYIPDIGVIAYGFYKENNIDAFLDTPKDIEDGKRIVKKRQGEGFEYLKEVDLPDNIVNSFLESARSKKQAEGDFQKKGADLVSLIDKK